MNTSSNHLPEGPTALVRAMEALEKGDLDLFAMLYKASTPPSEEPAEWKRELFATLLTGDREQEAAEVFRALTDSEAEAQASEDLFIDMAPVPLLKSLAVMGMVSLTEDELRGHLRHSFLAAGRVPSPAV